MESHRQTTLSEQVTLSGFGVHSNSPAQIVLRPSAPNSGINFRRTGLSGASLHMIPAKWSSVLTTDLCTVIGDATASVATVEHVVAALSGLGIDNCTVEVDGPEAPIMDGSAAAFVEAIDDVGVVAQNAMRRRIKILKTVRVESGRSFSELRPSAAGLRLDVEIDFADPVIGRQRKVLDLDPVSFRREVCRARTFGFLADVEMLWKNNMALGASLENTVVLDKNRVVNPEGLRQADEFVAHKTLDAVGDLALAGLPIIGSFLSFCGGHKMNVAVVKALFADPLAYRIVGGVHVGTPDRRRDREAEPDYAMA
jgi:UDP-3-O-[3-hydroxymyristoyl] N-acetylglucosamine deacetylase